MREKPILFSGPMVRAILNGRKSQTRRVCKPQPGDWAGKGDRGVVPLLDGGQIKVSVCDLVCPYGVPGGTLWVKENCWIAPKRFGNPDLTNCTDPDGDRRVVGYSASMDGDSVRCAKDFGVKESPSIFMPRWASRLTLEIVSVRVERLQEISATDARAEGVGYAEFTTAQEDKVCRKRSAAQFQGKPELVNDMGYAAIQKYAVLWDSINGKSHPWESNPWVWVIEFKRVEHGR